MPAERAWAELRAEAAALGPAPWPVVIHYAFMSLVSVTAVGAFDAVGSILVVALMIAPPSAAYLLSDASPYQTGDVVTIDGGEALLSGQQFAGLTHLDRDVARAMMARLKPKH